MMLILLDLFMFLSGLWERWFVVGVVLLASVLLSFDVYSWKIYPCIGSLYDFSIMGWFSCENKLDGAKFSLTCSTLVPSHYSPTV